MQTVSVGERVGEYRVESVVESAPLAVVCAARQEGLERSVRLYVASSAVGTQEGERFLARARALAGVEDSRVAPVLDAAVADGRPYAVVGEVPGHRLDDVLSTGPLARDRALRIGHEVGIALHALEEQGLAPTLVPARAVHLIEGPDRERAVLMPLELAFAGPGSSGRALAALLTEMLGPAPPERLRVLLAAPPDSAAALAEAALAAGGRRRSRIPAIVGAAIAVAVAAAALMLVTGPDTREALAPAGRVAAVVPLGVQPTSVTVGEGAVWVGAVDGTVLQIDARTREVAGAPIRVSGPVDDSTVRAGAGGVFVLAGATVHRIDPESRRVTRRAGFGRPVLGATVADGAVWVTRAPRPGGAPDVLPLDPKTLEPAGRPVPSSLVAQDVDVGDGAVWTSSPVNGTVTRADARTGDRREIRTGVSAFAGALGHGAYWVPDDQGETLARIDARTGELDPRVVRLGASAIAATATRDAVWVMTLSGLARDAPGHLHRIDPRTMRELGRPVALGPGPGWPAAGAGLVWVYSRSRRALLAVAPTRPAPAARAAERPVGQLRAGPLPAGLVTDRRFAAPFSIELSGNGWLGLPGGRTEAAMALVHEPRASLTFMFVNRAFRSENDAAQVTSEDEVLQALRRHLSLTVHDVRRTTLARRPATRIDASVHPGRRWPDFCPRACAPVVGNTNVVVLAQAGDVARIYLVEHAGRVLAISLIAPRGGVPAQRLEAALASLRFLE